MTRKPVWSLPFKISWSAVVSTRLSQRALNSANVLLDILSIGKPFSTLSTLRLFVTRQAQEANRQRTAISGNLKEHFLADLFLLTGCQKVLNILDRFSINVGNNIAAAHAMLLCLTPCFHRGYQ